ncbi:MAG TPA: zinc-dependent metalloprotease, partial [Longimicrobiaceae bacterium]|nr:zinc-dependent metalloprotease [Longimicrobiaceae bacterium]
PAGAPAAQDTTRRPAAGPFKPFAEVTRDARHRPGFFDTYEKGDALYLAVPADRLEKDFLLSYQISQGIGANGLFGGTMLNIFEGSVVALERHGDRVLLVRKPVRFTAPQGSPTEQAVNLTFGSSVLETAKIESIRDDGTILVNIYDWVVSDLSGVGERVRFAVAQPGQNSPPPVPIEKGRSYVESVKAFPENLNIRAKLTFRPSQAAGINSVPDGRYIPVGVAYTLTRLPETPMTPREADDRVGYFMTVRKDFTREDDNFFHRQINRWRLEPGRQVEGGLWEPKKPIVYYLDPNIPEAYRPAVKAGVEAWSAAFEAAGWKNAIRAEMLPADADAEDMRYPTLRWNVSDAPGYGAIGPSIVDPRTGEILDADILIEASMILGFRRDWRTMVTPAAAVAEMFAAPEGAGERASLAAELGAQGTLLRTLLAASGELGPNDPVPMEYVNQALKWVTMHEVGHTLGLRHNFRSSVDTPLEKLSDRGWAEQNGVFSSVMEYPSVNLSEAGKPRGYAYNPGVGSYDRWVITFGYAADEARARQVAREAALPGHAYGTDEDSGGPGAIDPTVNVYDLGADPLAWAKGRAQVIAGVWPRLPNYVLADNRRYAELTDAFNGLLFQYARAVAVGVKYIGGQYQYRDRVGDPSGRPPFVPVPQAKQREALAFVTEYGFGERAFAIPQEVLARFGANRWSHWGTNSTVNGRIDYPLTELVAGLQAQLLNQITNPWTFAKIRDAELKFGAANTLPIPVLMNELTRAVWSETWSGGRNVTAMRRDLQRAYLDRFSVIVALGQDRMPGDARAVARTTLMDLRRRISSSLASPGRLDAMTVAHLTEARARIDKALEAGLDVELAR